MPDRLDDLERRVSTLEQLLGAGSLERGSLGALQPEDTAVVSDRPGFCTATPGCILPAGHTPDCWDGVQPAKVMEVPPGVLLPPHLRSGVAEV